MADRRIRPHDGGMRVDFDRTASSGESMVIPHRPKRPSRVPRVVLLALVLLIPFAASAQTVEGRLVSRETEAAVAGGTVRLVDADSQVVGQSLTASDGVFLLRAPAPGRYFLLASAPGHETSETDAFALDAGGRRVTFVIGRAAVRLDALTVEAAGNARADRLWYGGFYERMRAGEGGRFVTREEIEMARPQHVADLLRRFPALDVRVGSYGEFGAGRRLVVRLRQPLSIRSACWSALYLNGMRVDSNAIDTLDPDDIEGIEVYTGAAIPPQFNGVDSACGVVAVWLRAGG
jgi:Carboxypeptidase regulatory-like domain/TonB-dependent Receptor Plug Domain